MPIRMFLVSALWVAVAVPAPALEVLFDFDEWHHVAFTWGGPADNFEVWGDGALLASSNVPSSGAWGSSSLGRGSGYNFALGMIHERAFSTGSPTGIMFADLEIWDEYRAFGSYQPPEPATIVMLSLGGLTLLRRRRGCGGRG